MFQLFSLFCIRSSLFGNRSSHTRFFSANCFPLNAGLASVCRPPSASTLFESVGPLLRLYSAICFDSCFLAIKMSDPEDREPSEEKVRTDTCFFWALVFA